MPEVVLHKGLEAGEASADYCDVRFYDAVGVVSVAWGTRVGSSDAPPHVVVDVIPGDIEGREGLGDVDDSVDRDAAHAVPLVSFVHTKLWIQDDTHKPPAIRTHRTLSILADFNLKGLNNQIGNSRIITSVDMFTIAATQNGTA